MKYITRRDIDTPVLVANMLSMNTETLTPSMIRALSSEAAAVGDLDMVHCCRLALHGDDDAAARAADAINDARGTDDSREFVRVVVG